VKRGAIATLLAAALAAPLLAGCGEKEEPPTTGPVVAQTTAGQATQPNGGGNGGSGGGGQQGTEEEQIRATVTDFLTKPNDPSVCDELVTEDFLKQAYGDRKNCVAARKPGALADEATILGRKPGRGGATVVSVNAQGGVYAGQTLQLTLVESGGRWRIDKISGDAKVGP
jgi:hypothetical protein